MTTIRKALEGALVVAATVAAVGGGSAAAVAAPQAGVATLSSTEHGSLIRSGDPTTRFTVSLPAGAACPEDSSKGAVVRSFLVPAGTDPMAVVYTAGYPGTGWWLADPTGTPMFPVNVARDTALIPALSQPLVWGGLLTGKVPLRGSGGIFDTNTPQSGVWDGGVACTLAGRVQRYWAFEVEFVPAGAASFTWRLAGTTPTGSSSRMQVIGVGAAVIAAGVGLTIVASRRRAARFRHPPEGRTADDAAANPRRAHADTIR